MKEFDAVIIGAGPAGLCASIEAASYGVKCLVIDENQETGGQLRKQIHKFFGSSSHFAGKRGFEIAALLMEEAKTKDVAVMTCTRAFGLWEWGENKIITAERNGNETVTVETSYVILATGARENTLVFSGNTLPGVISAGAAQTMMNLYHVKPGHKALIVGAGNVGVIVAYQMLLAGIQVAAVIDLSDKAGAYEVHLRKLKRRGIPVYTRTVLKEVTGKEKVELAVISSVNEKGELVSGTEKKLDVDLVCIAAGMSPNNQISKAFGCRQVFEKTIGGMLPVHNRQMETSVPEILVAGDLAGVEEASTAMDEGRLAGLQIAYKMGYISIQLYERRKKELEESLSNLRSGSFGNRRRQAKERVYYSFANSQE